MPVLRHRSRTFHTFLAINVSVKVREYACFDKKVRERLYSSPDMSNKGEGTDRTNFPMCRF